MSGVAKGVGKVFKGIAGIVKKVAPIALPMAAAIFTGGAALPALGAAGAAGAGAAGAAGATAAATGAAAAGSGVLGGFGQILSNPIVGSAISGLGNAMMEKGRLREEEDALIRAEDRKIARWDGAGEAMRLNGFSDALAPGETTTAETSARTDASIDNAGYQTTRYDEPPRRPKVRYDREKREIVWE